MNSQKMFVNPDQIQFIEIAPDTIVTFSNGDKLLTKTTPDEIIKRIVEFRQKASLPEVIKK